MSQTERVAVAQLVSGGKEQLVLIRPYQNGLVMHTAYYSDEVRDFDQVQRAESARVGREEVELAKGLIHQMSAEKFQSELFEDEYRLRVLATVEAKRKGEEMTVAPEPKARLAPTIDLIQALKRSLERPADRKRAISRPAQKKRAKAGGRFVNAVADIVLCVTDATQRT